MPDIGRWGTVDPMGDERNWVSPYNYVQNNPIMRIDPNGMLDDYYNTKGEFLYKDNKKTDNIMIVSDEGAANASLIKDLAVGDETAAYEAALSKNSVGINDAGLSDEAASNVFTDIMGKMDDVDMSKLHNGMVSIYSGGSNKDGSPSGFNDPERPTGTAKTNIKGITNSFRGEANEGTIKVTVNFSYGSNGDLGTVSNVQNSLGVHEYQGHGIKRYGIGGGKHHKAYNLQENHATWKTTTPAFKRGMLENKNDLIKGGKIGRAHV